MVKEVAHIHEVHSLLPHILDGKFGGNYSHLGSEADLQGQNLSPKASLMDLLGNIVQILRSWASLSLWLCRQKEQSALCSRFWTSALIDHDVNAEIGIKPLVIESRFLHQAGPIFYRHSFGESMNACQSPK